MTEYRAFFVGPDGHFQGFEPIHSPTDEDAIAKASRLMDGLDVELWCGTRLVISLKRNIT